jgi:hypothetical protein
MSFQAKLMITLLLLGTGILVVELLRTKKLTESYTLLWLFIVVLTMVATWSERLLTGLAIFFGTVAPVSALTLLSLAFILVMLIFFSMKVSRLDSQVKRLAQELALRSASSPGLPSTPPPR